MTEPLLDVRGLDVSYRTGSRSLHAVRGVDLTVAPGEVVALVGESGSGKSTIAQTVLGLLPATASVEGGRLGFRGHDLTTLGERSFRTLRGREIAYVPQDPGVSLNPVKRVGAQVAEVLVTHGLADRRRAAVRAVELLERAGLPRPDMRARQYPHELSGGMRQRVLVAIAVAAEPALLVADEPTSALDVTVQRRILDQLDELVSRLGTAVLLITHDLGVAADRADRLVVMSRGRVVETGPVAEVLDAPRDSYTRGLVDSAPGLRLGETEARQPVAPPRTPLLEVRNLTKDFPLSRGASIRAVDGVSFTVARGETLALVGESGSGKSTTGRLALRLAEPTSGGVRFDGEDVTKARGGRRRTLRRRAQLVYQNPYASLDPRMSVVDLVTEPLRIFRVGDKAARRRQAAELVDQVALPASVLARKPAELSGGHRQRVAIARSLALGPDLLVCDEPVSALDVSVQAQVLDLLVSLQQANGVAYLFISHDLAVVRQIAHQVGVMRDGRLVELAETRDLFDTPQHDHTRELLASVAGTGKAA